MEKKYYIQPKMSVQTMMADKNVMLLGSPTALEPGKLSAPKIVPPVNIQQADSARVF